MLVAISGLPGVGKTTVARALAGRLTMTHLRIDSFETALLRQRLVPDAAHLSGHGYALALAAADTCLVAGTPVIVDAVFPIEASRAPFADLAGRHGCAMRWFRLVCGDATEHRRRVEGRSPDLPGQVVPGWPDVLRRVVDDWRQPHTVIDTATGDPVAEIERELRAPADGQR